MNLQAISAVVLTKNSALYLYQCLQALSTLGEVVVLDNGSTDNTLTIAKSFANVQLYTSPFIGFGPLKNLGASKARHDWILTIDSDEVVSPELLSALEDLQPDTADSHGFLRKNYYRHQWVNAAGWQNEFVYRLYHRQFTSYTTAAVHESLLVKGSPQKIAEGWIDHFSFDSPSALLHKLDHYTRLFAEEKRHKKQSGPLTALGKGFFAFFKFYFLKQGYKQGLDGLLVAASNANGTLYKYLRLADMNRPQSCSLIIATYNWPQALEKVLESVRHQTRLPDEVIVADDGSREETVQLVKNFQQRFPVPLLHCWQPDEGFRAGRARNIAIAAAKSEYTIILDGDMVIHPAFVEDHLKAAENGYFIQGSRVLVNKETTNELLSSRGGASLSLFSKGIKNHLNAIRSPFLSSLFSKKVLHHQGVRSCNMSFWKKDLLEVNGFNEAIQGWGREDSELVVRLLNYGLIRKNLKFGGVAFHLHHSDNDRSSLQRNDVILEEAIRQKKTSCDIGLQQHLPE